MRRWLVRADAQEQGCGARCWALSYRSAAKGGAVPSRDADSGVSRPYAELPKKWTDGIKTAWLVKYAGEQGHVWRMLACTALNVARLRLSNP